MAINTTYDAAHQFPLRDLVTGVELTSDQLAAMAGAVSAGIATDAVLACLIGSYVRAAQADRDKVTGVSQNYDPEALDAGGNKNWRRMNQFIVLDQLDRPFVAAINEQDVAVLSNGKTFITYVAD